MKLSPWLVAAAALTSLVACGDDKPAGPADIKLSAPVTNYRPSGGVSAVELHWTRVPAVDRYHVTVLAPDGAELWKTDVTSPPVMFSTEGVMATRATWQVEGFEGTTLRARSAKGELSLAPQPGTQP